MALFSQGVLTKKGQALIAKSETTASGIEITKAVTGSGVYEDTSVAALENKTELISPKQEFAISKMETVEGNAGVAVLTVVIHNRNLEQLYTLNELGIFANDPDEGEILYCLLVSTDNAIYLPADDGSGSISAVTERIYLEVVNANQTVINTTGAVVGRTEFDALDALVNSAVYGLRGGTEMQILVKFSDGDYGYGWLDSNTFTGPREDFPEEGRVGSIYIDTDSSEIYVWKLYEGEYQYFKLPLGAEASETLQAQITANRNAIITLQTRTTDLEHKFNEVVVTVPESGWASSTSDGIAIYTQTRPVTGMTAAKSFDVIPAPQSESAGDLEDEQKAIGVFWAHGTVDGGSGAITLTCRKKRPMTTFGIKIRGDLT